MFRPQFSFSVFRFCLVFISVCLLSGIIVVFSLGVVGCFCIRVPYSYTSSYCILSCRFACFGVVLFVSDCFGIIAAVCR